MSVHPSVCPSFKISVTTEPIVFYSSRNIPTGSLVVLSYFLGGWETPNHPKKQKNFFSVVYLKFKGCSTRGTCLYKYPLGAKLLEARDEAASIYIYIYIKQVLNDGNMKIRQWTAK